MLLRWQCVELVWNDQVMADEESGANRQLGFIYLYELVTRKCHRRCRSSVYPLRR